MSIPSAIRAIADPRDLTSELRELIAEIRASEEEEDELHPLHPMRQIAPDTEQAADAAIIDARINDACVDLWHQLTTDQRERLLDIAESLGGDRDDARILLS